MYYTTSGSYKKTKMIIDYTNIVLTIAATVIFIIIIDINRFFRKFFLLYSVFYGNFSF